MTTDASMITAEVQGFRIADNGDAYDVTPVEAWDALTIPQQDVILREFDCVTRRERDLQQAMRDPLDTLPGERAYEQWKEGK